MTAFVFTSLMDVTAIISFMMQKRDVNNKVPGILYGTKIMTSL